MLNLSHIRAMTLDLDDTLWPVWPTIARAEETLQAWLAEHAPATAAWLAQPHRRQAVRAQVNEAHPDRAHDLSWLRREAIRQALLAAGDDASLADPAFEVFFEARQRVSLFEDAAPALERLSRRFAVVSLSNGNADVHRIGIGHHFKAVVTARDVGVKKPDPRIFQHAVDLLGLQPHEVLHVGDDFELDVVGAWRAGQPSAWINRGGQPRPDGAPGASVLECRSLAALCDQLAV